jgi:hypothetical protein
MEAAHCPKAAAHFCQTTRRRIPEDSNLILILLLLLLLLLLSIMNLRLFCYCKRPASIVRSLWQ